MLQIAHLVIISRDAIVRTVDGVVDCIQVVQDLPCGIDVGLAPIKVTK